MRAWMRSNGLGLGLGLGLVLGIGVELGLELRLGLLGEIHDVWEKCAGIRFSGEGVNPEMSVFRVG